jgi:hypothetical protein
MLQRHLFYERFSFTFTPNPRLSTARPPPLAGTTGPAPLFPRTPGSQDHDSIQMSRLRTANGSALARRRSRYQLPPLFGTADRAAHPNESLFAPYQQCRPPNESGAISVSVRSPACSTRRVNERAPAFYLSLHYHWPGLTNCGRFPGTYPRRAKTFTGGIGGGTKCAGCEHWNFLASVRSFLAGSAAILSYRFALEFASTRCAPYHGCSPLSHLRDQSVFALSDPTPAFLLVAQASCLWGKRASCPFSCYLMTLLRLRPGTLRYVFASVPSRFATVIGSPGFVTLLTRC